MRKTQEIIDNHFNKMYDKFYENCDACDYDFSELNDMVTKYIKNNIFITKKDFETVAVMEISYQLKLKFLGKNRSAQK